MLISNNALLIISKVIEITVLDDLKVYLLANHDLLKLRFEQLEACFRRPEASWIVALRLSIIVRFLPIIVDYILGWRWEDVTDRKARVATTHRRLGTSRGIRLLATIINKHEGWVVQFHCRQYPSGSSIDIETCGNITHVCTTTSIRLLPAAPKLSDFPADVWQTSDHSIQDWHNGGIHDWCNYRNYRFITPRPVPWDQLSTVFTHPRPSNVGIHIGDCEAYCLIKEIGRGIATIQRTCTSQVMWPAVSSSSSSESTQHQEEQKKHWCDEIHTNMHEVHFLSRGLVELILPWVKANLRELVQCCLDFVTLEVSLGCHEPFSTRPVWPQITDSGNTTFDFGIPLLGARVSNGSGLPGFGPGGTQTKGPSPGQGPPCNPNCFVLAGS